MIIIFTWNKHLCNTFFSGDSWGRKNVVELKNWLQGHGLPTRGRKNELIKRIKDFLEEQQAIAEGNNRSHSSEDDSSSNVDSGDEESNNRSRSAAGNSNKKSADDSSSNTDGGDYESNNRSRRSAGKNNENADDSSEDDSSRGTDSDDDKSNNLEGDKNVDFCSIISNTSDKDDSSNDENSANGNAIDSDGIASSEEGDHDNKNNNPNDEDTRKDIAKSGRKLKNSDPMEHIAASTFDFETKSKSTKTRSTHSKVGYRERMKKKREGNIEHGNNKFARKREAEMESLTCSGLFCCDAIDTTTQNRCVAGPFSSGEWLKRHKERCDKGINSHMYPAINSITQTTIDATSGKWALSLACGSMTNRDRAVSAPCEIFPSKEILNDDRVQKYWMESGCYRRDNKKWKKPQYRASEALNSDLEALFVEGEKQSSDGSRQKATKYTAVEAVSVLRNMVDEDGHRKYRIGGPNGPPPDVAFVKARFSKRKNNGAKALIGPGAKGDKYDSVGLIWLKEAYIAAFGGEIPTLKKVLSKILEIDDDIKHGGHDNQYSLLNATLLSAECKNRKLPSKLGKDAFKTVLRANDKLRVVEATRSDERFLNASDLAAASATLYGILNNSSNE